MSSTNTTTTTILTANAGEVYQWKPNPYCAMLIRVLEVDASGDFTAEEIDAYGEGGNVYGFRADSRGKPQDFTQRHDHSTVK